MKTTMKAAALILLLAGLAALSSHCIMEDRVIEVVLNDSTCANWNENHLAAAYVNDVTVNYADEINRILEDNGISRDEIVSAHLVRVSYGVTQFSHTHDWLVTGYVTVGRSDISDGPGPLFEYMSQSIADALGESIDAPLAPDGVGVINRALEDFLAGGSPVLVFRVANSGVSPVPSVDDPIRFNWRACVYLQVVTELETEVPDPF